MSIAAKANRKQELKNLQRVLLSTPTDLTPEATRDVTGAMNATSLGCSEFSTTTPITSIRRT